VIHQPGEIGDPRVFRWVEAGVSGLAALREWDATVIAEVPELEHTDLGEIEFRVLSDGTVVGNVPPEALEKLTKDLDLDRPYAAQAVRQDRTEWAVAALQVDSQTIELPKGIDALMLEVAVPPDEDIGETTYYVEGEALTELSEGPLGEALRELERLGRDRFQGFVARADKVDDGRWELTVDPL